MKKTRFNPKISVIVPVYNIENYVKKCIESIVKQIYDNLEIILVDDGSKDDSGKICDEYACRDRRIRVIHKKNGGLVSARKAGIAEATGNYATYVDGDDWIESDMYARLIEKIGNADVIVSGVIRDYHTRFIRETNKLAEGFYEGTALNGLYRQMIYNGKFYERGIQPHVFNCLFKRELLLKNQLAVPDEINVGEDAACLYPALLDADQIVLSNDSYYHYVMRENSIMGTNDGKELERYKVLYQYLMDRFAAYLGCREELLLQLKYLMLYTLLLKEPKLLQSEKNMVFPYKGIETGAKIAIYGKGRFGKEFKNYLESGGVVKIERWIDNNEINKANINTVYENCDYIIVTVLIKEIADQIKHELQNMGVEDKKIKCIDEKEITLAISRIDEILNNN